MYQVLSSSEVWPTWLVPCTQESSGIDHAKIPPHFLQLHPMRWRIFLMSGLTSTILHVESLSSAGSEVSFMTGSRRLIASVLILK